MKRLLRRHLVYIASVLTISAQAQSLQSGNGTAGTTAPDWENPAVLGINKLPYHATLQLPSKWKECKEIGAANQRKGPKTFTMRITM